ncbi:MAG TPA: BrnA antitoxin family protein [Sphingomonas sp.]|nr:BrnA antitoxin family protein [Sphingomonas sp.]
MTAKSASTIGLSADPHDPDDFDVSEAEIERALAVRRKRGRPSGSHKEQVTLRVDSEVLDYFKHAGPGWQTRMNAVLRKAMEETAR